MDSKKSQRLSKATVATVLAASGVVIAMPQPTNAYTFSDLNQYADYYEPILDLANRKIATGYSDGTFKPNQAITREDAAKMLALTIDVNISNPANPRFSDVVMSNPNYRYIAALAEAGIINGYSDGTFKPKEPITRAQMAKILTLGFKFGVSSKLNHGFNDVSAKNANAYFIQTLVDLKVTKGTTVATFSPFKTVTRGQMATFISRAEKADKGNPIYTVGEITGDKVYINGVAHTIAPHLRSVLSAANKNILKGATIEGTYAGNTLTNISKLTINASGTSSRLLAFDGGDTSFAGELIIHGSYLRLKNIDFTGPVEIADAPRRSLAAIQNIRFASTGNFAQFIDWGKPNESKNEDFLNPIDNETLQNKPDPDKPAHLQKYDERMAKIQHYVDFDNAEVRNLYVTGDRTFVKSDNDFDRITVRGNVTNFELYANANALYIDTDYNVTFYGEHDARYVYKNTLKNIYFNTSSTYDYYYVTTGSGYTDIGPHVYIDTAIIPPGKTVNTIFDDYKTDNPSIGWIEDEDGTPVDRDPVENTVIVDETPPKITRLDVKAGGTIADVTLTADEDGTYYYIVQESSLRPPSISEIKTGGKQLSGSGPIIMDELVKFQLTGLDSLKEYTIYAIVIDAADNVSDKAEASFKTIDSRPPTFALKKGEPMYGGKRLEFIIEKISESGEYYYYIREKSSAPDPTVDEIIENYTGKGVISEPGDITIRETQIGAASNKEDIRPSTDYEIYAVMVDASGNKMRNPAEKLPIKTEAPDLTNPFIPGEAILSMIDEEKGIFEFETSEELDPISAAETKNFELSGTGVLNITGQKTMYPTKVEVNGQKVRLTIPVLNALVKNDTVRVTVSKNVLDLAENPFESADNYPEDQNAPRNVAYYTHEDTEKPVIKLNKVIVEGTRNLVEFEAPKKAGTYYYMILESNYDFEDKGITPRDFADEFTADSIGKTTKFGTASEKDYTGNLLNQSGPAELGLNTRSVTIDFDRLSTFKSYSIYMVIKDRAGLVGDMIVSAPIVADSKAPLISGLMTKVQENANDSVNFSFTADETGKMMVIPVKKYIFDTTTNEYKLNSEFFEVGADGQAVLKPIPNVQTTTSSQGQRESFEAIAARAGVSIREERFSKGPNTLNIDRLEAHQEYGFYVAMEDFIGESPNFTIFERSTTNTTEPASPNEPNGAQMLRDAYTDGVKAKIEEVIKREGQLSENDPKFTITFSEAIMRQSDLANYNKPGAFDLDKILVIKDASGTPITGDYMIDGTYGTGITDTTKPSNLVIKLKTPDIAKANRTFTVELIDAAATVYDYKGANGFDTTKIGKYLYPSAVASKIRDATLTGRQAGSTSVPASRTLLAIAYLDIDLTVDQTYYYAVTAGGVTSVDPQQVMALVANPNTPNTDIIAYGSGKLAANDPNAKQFRQTLTAPPGINGGMDPIFTAGNHIYMFTIDKYGNIVWAHDEANSTNKYRPIIVDPGSPLLP